MTPTDRLLAAPCARAWDEWFSSDDSALWESTSGDGLADGTSTTSDVD